MRKLCELDTHFPTGEATVQPVYLWGRQRALSVPFTKTASEAAEYIKSVEPRPGMSIVLVLALGAYEVYDLNRNGDGFNEHAYRVGFKPTCGCCTATNGWVTQEETLPNYHNTFEQYAKNYRHHVNKDPLKAVGEVLKSFWNPYMHRVELLVGLENEKAPDLAQRIADGDYPPVSMGCRIKYDVCTICGHQAPTRDKYCVHLKHHMREVMKGGLRAGALNPRPRFFDISWVVRPADQTGYMMKKVADVYEVRTAAELGEYLDAVDEKRAAIQKISDIDKVVRGLVVDHKTSPLSPEEARAIARYRDTELPHVVSGMPDIDDGTLSAWSRKPLTDVLSTLTSQGIILTTPEFIKLVVEAMSPGTSVSEEALDAIVALQGELLESFAQHPQLLDQLRETGIFDYSADRIDPDIAAQAARYIEKRSSVGDYLSRAVVPPRLRPEEPRWTDTLTVTDPSTGSTYRTNRGAAVRAHDEIAKKDIAKMVGGAALLAGGYKILAPGLPQVAKPIAAGTAALLGYKHLRPDAGPQYMSNEGVAVPRLTELHQKQGGLALPVLGSAALVTALGHDYDSRLRRGMPFPDASAPVHQRLIHRLGEYASEHPALSFLTGLGAYGLGRSIKLSAYLEQGCSWGEDTVRLPTFNMDKVAARLGVVLR